MLKKAVENCPESLWDDAEYKNRFWHIAFHTLFYMHFYLQDTEGDFKPWAKHRENYQFMGPLPWPPHDIPQIGTPYSREEVLEYLELCKKQVDERVELIDLEVESGFHWLPFGKLELQIYNIRHIMHHAGQLIDRLKTAADISTEWIGTKPYS